MCIYLGAGLRAPQRLKSKITNYTNILAMAWKKDSKSRLPTSSHPPTFLPPFWIEKDLLVFCFLCPASSFAPMSSNQIFLLCYGRDLWDRPFRLSCWDVEIYFQDNSLAAQLPSCWKIRSESQGLSIKLCFLYISKITFTSPVTFE